MNCERKEPYNCEREAIKDSCCVCGKRFCLLHGSERTTLSDKPICLECSNELIRSYF